MQECYLPTLLLQAPVARRHDQASVTTGGWGETPSPIDIACCGTLVTAVNTRRYRGSMKSAKREGTASIIRESARLASGAAAKGISGYHEGEHAQAADEGWVTSGVGTRLQAARCSLPLALSSSTRRISLTPWSKWAEYLPRPNILLANGSHRVTYHRRWARGAGIVQDTYSIFMNSLALTSGAGNPDERLLTDPRRRGSFARKHAESEVRGQARTPPNPYHFLMTMLRPARNTTA